LTRVAIALQYIAGGSPYDLCPLFGVGRSDAFRSIWMFVEATHRTKLFNLVFPVDHDAQRELARQFSIRSQVGFDCCVGAIDGILILHDHDERMCIIALIKFFKYFFCY
jgi:hypothetical protein